MAKCGRKPVWDTLEKKLSKIERMAGDGYTDKEMAHNLNVSLAVWYKLKKEKIEFKEALSRGKEIANQKVENALFKRAVGYSFTEFVQEYGIKEDGTKYLKSKKRIRKSLPGDVVAQSFFLRNRKPEEWRDRQEIDMSVNVRKQVEEELQSKPDSVVAEAREIANRIFVKPSNGK